MRFACRAQIDAVASRGFGLWLAHLSELLVLLERRWVQVLVTLNSPDGGHSHSHSHSSPLPLPLRVRYGTPLEHTRRAAALPRIELERTASVQRGLSLVYAVWEFHWCMQSAGRGCRGPQSVRGHGADAAVCERWGLGGGANRGEKAEPTEGPWGGEGRGDRDDCLRRGPLRPQQCAGTAASALTSSSIAAISSAFFFCELVNICGRSPSPHRVR